MTNPIVITNGRNTCTLYHADCLDVLPTLSGIDAVITDPPYGMSYESGWKPRAILNDDSTAVRDAALRHISGLPALVFGRWDCKRPDNVRTRLIWSKGEWPGMGDLKFPWGPSDEEIYVIGDGFTGKRTGTVLSFNRLTGDMQHPNEKPVALIGTLIRKCPGETIADPFMGSGTTGIACLRTGRNFVGIEKDARYFEIARERIEREARQGILL